MVGGIVDADSERLLDSLPDEVHGVALTVDVVLQAANGIVQVFVVALVDVVLMASDGIVQRFVVALTVDVVLLASVDIVQGFVVGAEVGRSWPGI